MRTQLLVELELLRGLEQQRGERSLDDAVKLLAERAPELLVRAALSGELLRGLPLDVQEEGVRQLSLSKCDSEVSYG